MRSQIVALDGHDAAGKTTLAKALAKAIGGLYLRPFHGSLGAALLQAGEQHNLDEVIALGEEGIGTAIQSVESGLPMVLDRSWMTVASLIEQDHIPTFFERWQWWIPTALCWADLTTTMRRLAAREEPQEKVAVHQHYLAIYKSLAERAKAFVIRTDIYPEPACIQLLSKWFTEVQEQKWVTPGLG